MKFSIGRPRLEAPTPIGDQLTAQTPYVLFVPGWYPKNAGDMAGIFFRNQYELLSKHFNIVLMSPGLRSVRPTRHYGESLETDLTSSSVRWPWRKVEAVWSEQFARKYDLAIKMHGRPSVLHISGASRRCDPDLLEKIRQDGVTIISSEHESSFFNPASDIVQKRIRSVHERCAEVTAVSSVLATAVEQISGPRDIKILPNVIDTDCSGTAQKQPGLTIVTACSLIDIKRVDLIIDSFAILQKSMNAQLVIVGDGPRRAVLEAQAEKTCAPGSVRFVGQLDQARSQEEIARAHVYVNASRRETFGVAIGEALAMGIPVVCTDSGGPRDFVNSANGVIVPSDDPQDLAHGLHTVATNLGDYNAADIQQDFRSSFGPTAFVRRVSELYPAEVSRG